MSKPYFITDETKDGKTQVGSNEFASTIILNMTIDEFLKQYDDVMSFRNLSESEYYIEKNNL